MQQDFVKKAMEILREFFPKIQLGTIDSITAYCLDRYGVDKGLHIMTQAVQRWRSVSDNRKFNRIPELEDIIKFMPVAADIYLKEEISGIKVNPDEYHRYCIAYSCGYHAKMAEILGDVANRLDGEGKLTELTAISSLVDSHYAKHQATSESGLMRQSKRYNWLIAGGQPENWPHAKADFDFPQEKNPFQFRVKRQELPKNTKVVGDFYAQVGVKNNLDDEEGIF